MWVAAKKRLHELLVGIVSGSAAAVLLFFTTTIIDYVYQGGKAYLPIALRMEFSHPARERAPLLITAIVLLLLVLGPFLKSSLRLYRSWSTGLLRGTWGVVGAVVSFACWIQPRHIVPFVGLGLSLLIITEFVQNSHKPRPYTPEEIGKWIPIHNRALIADIRFDDAIAGWEQDAVGRENFVKTVLTRVFINNKPAIGIVAAFGEGKSSVLRLIRISIERGDRAIAVPFQTWLPGGESRLVESLFETATAAIRKKYFLVQWRSTLAKYSRVISGAIPKPWEFVKDLVPPESQFQQIEELKELFSRLPIRVVFLLDEVDRMHQEELAALLKILRGVPEIPNISYVCASSKDALARVISPENSRHGMEYLEKFFPVQLQLPSLDTDLLFCLVSDHIDEILKRTQLLSNTQSRKLFDDALAALWHQVLKRRLTNFRLLGQVLRAFENSLSILRSEVNVFDLFVIELLRLLLPETYEFIYRNGQYFCSEPKGAERWIESQFDEKGKKIASAAAFEVCFSALSRSDQDFAFNLLIRIFPSVRAYEAQTSKGLNSISVMYDKEEKRVYDTNFFPRYFIYGVPATIFGEGEMDRFLGAIRGADRKKVESELDSIYPKTERDDRRRLDFMRRLEDRISEISPVQVEWLTYRFAEYTSKMQGGEIAFILTKPFIFKYADKLNGQALEKYLLNVMQHAGSNLFASEIVHRYIDDQDQPKSSPVLKESLKNAFAARMKDYYAKPILKDVELSGDDDLIALLRWKSYVPEDIEYFTEYLRLVFDSNPKKLAAFLRWILLANISFPEGSFKVLESLYPAKDIEARLKSAESSGVQWDAKDADAISLFWQNYSK